MDYANDNNEPWPWQPDDYYLQRDPALDIPSCLWDGANDTEDDLLSMLDETTPIKACTDIDYHASGSGDMMNKVSGELRESSQLKRRRMLQFNSHADDPGICDEQMQSAFVKSKDRENLLMEGSVPEDVLPENLQWASSFSDRCTSGNEGLDQSSEGWLETCFNNTDMNISSDEMNASGISDDQIDISEFYNIPPEVESGTMQVSPSPTPRSIVKVVPGRKSCMRTPTKLSTSVAYPFALIKPCGVQGDVTLKDINRRILTPPPSRSKHKKDEEDPSSPSYPTSAFSGKPVVVKTKIRTEGGKGSITITRTKG